MSTGLVGASFKLASTFWIALLIFINACYSGQIGIDFTKIGGWAEKCVKAEAGAFIGAM